MPDNVTIPRADLIAAIEAVKAVLAFGAQQVAIEALSSLPSVDTSEADAALKYMNEKLGLSG